MKKRVKHCIESCRFIHLFLCFVLVSGECSAFALFRTVVKLIMLYYSCFARKNVQLQALLCRLQNVFIIIRKKVIQHLRRTNKNGSPCIIDILEKGCISFNVIQLDLFDGSHIRHAPVFVRYPSLMDSNLKSAIFPYLLSIQCIMTWLYRMSFLLTAHVQR